MSTVKDLINRHFEGHQPATIALEVAVAILGAQYLVSLVEPGEILPRLDRAKWTLVRKLFSSIVRDKVVKAADAIKYPALAGDEPTTRIPSHGMKADDVVEKALVLHHGLDVDYRKGTLSGAVYHGGDAHTMMVNRVMEIFQWSNPLHVDVFGAPRKMEAEIVAMVLKMYNGDARPGSCGALTSGGTESIGMAMKSYRDWGRSRGITSPSIVAPVTAHPAFDKACAYYGLRLIKVPVGASGRVDPVELESYIRYDTIAIVGSAPTFPHGTVDPIKELSQIAVAHNVGLHVDCCLGSFIMPFLEKAGFPGHVVDFRLPGVTTISCDTHKYGFAPKGTSVIMYANSKLREYQFFACSMWPGGIYCSPGASGSKAGNVIAGTWAAMLAMGEDGYIESCRSIVSARIKMTDAIQSLPFLHLLGTPSASVFGFSSNVIDIYVLSDQLKARGWALNPLQFPGGLQFSVTLLQAQEGVADRFVADICELGGALYTAAMKDAAEGRPQKIGAQGGTLYGSQQRVSDRSILDDVMRVYLDGYYSTGAVVTK
eukprot:CAMPEP_0176422594 /NCGR_PEP_ID=MMETSP0127-20121128/9819_1 /TAXON_ID=938130 /ORGANISM="Platyophrya macrostoma, Strain WH" /LENGTH=541 /DNA_ID=CAMNT_0017803459 /DNA_START=43 /DNA_END=1668 /DNA_ORIENTATION=-